MFSLPCKCLPRNNLISHYHPSVYWLKAMLATPMATCWRISTYCGSRPVRMVCEVTHTSRKERVFCLSRKTEWEFYPDNHAVPLEIRNPSCSRGDIKYVPFWALGAPKGTWLCAWRKWCCVWVKVQVDLGLAQLNLPRMLPRARKGGWYRFKMMCDSSLP